MDDEDVLEGIRRDAWYASTVTTSGTATARLLVRALDYIEKLETRVVALEASERQGKAE